MAYSTANVTAYCGTGFSMINTPANASVLASASSAVVSVGTYNCLSLIGKKSGVVKVNDFAQIATCDYLKIVFSDNPIDTYWIVTGYEYLAGDTLSISIVLDGFLTCGGTSGITSISGYVKRKTCADDTFGKYNQSDSMLVPSQNLIFRSIDVFGKNTASEQYYNIVLSTINLALLGMADASDLGLTYGDISSGEAVTVPQIPQIPSNWKTVVAFGSHEYEIPGAFAFDLDGTSSSSGGSTSYPIREGIARARSLGVEGGIIAMYSLPKSKFNCVEPQQTVTIPLPMGQSVTFVFQGLITRIEPAQGASLSHTTSISFNYANVNNKRALYGDFAKVKVASMASGEVAEYDLEDLYSQTAQNTTIVIDEVGDGRAHGKPIFFPHYFMDKQQDVDMLMSSIAGLEWQNVPIVYQYSSGEGIQRNRYYANRAIDATNMIETQANQWADAIANTAGDVLKNPEMFLTGGWFDKAVDKGLEFGRLYNQQELETNKFIRARELEKKDLMVQTRVVAPEINFPVSPSIRDFIGNGVIVGFVTCTDSDLSRFDKILCQFGYSCSGDTLVLSDLTAGLHFSYVEASGVQIQTNIAVDRTIKEMCEQQISAGIRIWKQRPDFSLYSASNR